jgi:glycosyltransferase involved in cell wall biosynthesis
MPPKLSVIISNRNDISMMAVTLRSCIEELSPLGPGNSEVVVCDNSDAPVYAVLKSVLPSGYIRDKTLKLIRQDFPCLFTARETAAKNASGEYIFCVDSHMIIGHNVLVDLVNFMDSKSNDPTLGFAHAPLSWAHQHESRARHDRDMTKGELGPWGTAYKDVRTITWKGMPWICRRDWFLNRDKGLNGYGALAEHRVSWGGGDMHIGVKPWLLGFKNWAVPTRPCIHIGPFPKRDNSKGNPNSVVVSNPLLIGNEKYRLYGSSGNFPHTFGFLVSCYVLGGEPMMKRNEKMLTEKFGNFLKTKEWWNKAIELGTNEKKWLDSRKKLSFEQLLISKPWTNGHVNR